MDELVGRLGATLTLADCVAARRAATTVDPATLALAQAVSAHADVAIFTNNTLMLRDHLPDICPELFPWFSARVLCSAQFRRAKPDPQVFRDCLAALGARAERALFIDDKLDNIRGAQAAGLRAHHYRDLVALRNELHALHLLEIEHDAP